MFDSHHAAELLRRVEPDARLLALDALAGDASNRRYYRLRFLTAGTAATRIVMVLAGPEAFKQSEEKVSGGPEPGELPFVNLQRYLARAGVAVPRLDCFDAERGLLVLEDLGDDTLEAAARTADAAGLRALYEAAIDELVRLQVAGTGALDAGCVAASRAFDPPLLTWEFEHFLEYGLDPARPLAPAPRTRLLAAFEPLARELAALPRVLVHRDYHSRNLMRHAGRIRVIDFQDALMGPRVYDLASLLRDAYFDLTDPLFDHLVRYYLDRYRAATGEADDPTAFRRQLDLMSVQRNLKAAGRFVYIHAVKGNDRFLQYIPRTLGYVRRNVARYPELEPIGEILAPHLEARQR